MSKGLKYDNNKAPIDLVPAEGVLAVAEVLGFGAKKYSRGNWAKGIDNSRLISAAMRHLMAFNQGEDKDPESGLSHVAHAACNIFFLLYNIKNRPELDDRWIKELKSEQITNGDKNE